MKPLRPILEISTCSLLLTCRENASHPLPVQDWQPRRQHRTCAKTPPKIMTTKNQINKLTAFSLCQRIWRLPNLSLWSPGLSRSSRSKNPEKLGSTYQKAKFRSNKLWNRSRQPLTKVNTNSSLSIGKLEGLTSTCLWPTKKSIQVYSRSKFLRKSWSKHY